MQINVLLDTLSQRNLDRGETREVFGRLMGGLYSDVEIAGLTAALKARGESPEEIAGAAAALRTAALPFPRPEYRLADTCGTGGDSCFTFNVSTAVALVSAELGIPVAKHGNRAVSSRAGSADVLEACGVRLDAPPPVARRCLDTLGICFLFAPLYHTGVRHAMPVRRTFATRTIFNVLGPLANPAAPAVQLLGVYDPRLCRPVAETLALLGTESALVVHGDGLDEIALHGPTTAAHLHDGRVREFTILPEQAGLRTRPLPELSGGTPAENATLLRDLLSGGGTEAQQDVVALNVAGLAYVAGRARSLAEGVELAREALRRGGAGTRLARLAELSHGT